MKRLIALIIILTYFSSSSVQKLNAASEKVELKTSAATLSIDKKGNLTITGNDGVDIQIKTSVYDLWKIDMKNNVTRRQAVSVPDRNIEWGKSGNVIELVQDKFMVQNEVLSAKAEFKISVSDDAFCFSGDVKMPEEWKIIELTYPDFNSLKVDDEDIKIFWPNSLGECFDDPGKFGSRSFEYPGTHGSMAWFSVNAHGSGIYIGGHDSSMGSKKFYLNYSDPGSFETGVTFPVYSNNFTIPDVMIMPYSGKWYKASKFYREWYDITEGTVDALLPYVDAFHGLGPGQRIMPNGFPELFRYTFPESIIIQLNASPATKRSDVNFAVVYGLRHEIMCRYKPDVAYLKYKEVPTMEDYRNYYINDPPDLSTINSASPEEITAYTHAVIQFENDNSDFFRHGDFIDEDGIMAIHH